MSDSRGGKSAQQNELLINASAGETRMRLPELEMSIRASCRRCLTLSGSLTNAAPQ